MVGERWAGSTDRLQGRPATSHYNNGWWQNRSSGQWRTSDWQDNQTWTATDWSSNTWADWRAGASGYTTPTPKPKPRNRRGTRSAQKQVERQQRAQTRRQAAALEPQTGEESEEVDRRTCSSHLLKAGLVGWRARNRPSTASRGGGTGTNNCPRPCCHTPRRESGQPRPYNCETRRGGGRRRTIPTLRCSILRTGIGTDRRRRDPPTWRREQWSNHSHPAGRRHRPNTNRSGWPHRSS